MVILYCLISFVVAYLLDKGFRTLKLLKSKELSLSNLFLSFWKDDVVVFGFVFLISLFNLIFQGGAGAWNYMLMNFIFSLILLIAKPFSLVKKCIDKRSFVDKKFIATSLLVLSMILEVSVFNARSYKNGAAEENISFDSSLVVSINGPTKNEDGSYNFKNGAYVVMSGLDQRAGQVFEVEFANETDSRALYLTFFSTEDDGSTWTRIKCYEMNPIMEESHQVKIPSNLTPKTKVEVWSCTSHFFDRNNANVKGFKINSPVKIHFSLLRFGAIAGLALLFSFFVDFVFGEPNTAILDEDCKVCRFIKSIPTHRKVLGALGLIAIVSVAIVVITAFIDKESFFFTTEFVEANIQKNGIIDIYTDLAYSISKGRISLGISASDALIQAEKDGFNVYDPSWRSSHGISAVWDHAYYNGHYYSYYGILPALFVYMPLYWLSGGTLIANSILSQMIGIALLIPAFIALLVQLARLFFKNVNWRHFAFAAFVALMTSLVFAAITYKDEYFHEGIYHLPIIFGMLNMDIFFIFAIEAYLKPNRRMLYMALSGLFYVFIIASRPNLVFSVLLVAPLYISFFFDKNKSLKKRLLEFVPMFVVLGIGAALVCTYNYMRFDSIVEFGQSYQINFDQTHLTYSKDKLIPSLFHWFFRPPNIKEETFPWVVCGFASISLDDVPYNQSFYGLCFVPIFNIIFFTPFISKKNGWLRALLAMIPLLIVIEAFTTYSKAGICPRYLLETFHMASLGTLLGIMTVFDQEKQKEKRSISLPLVVTIVALISVFITLNLTFDSFDGRNIGDSYGILLRLREAFMGYNY